jgi:DNA-directed RNA polymerase specialized sigma24 family protein
MKEIDYIRVVERDHGKLIGIVSHYFRLQRADAEDIVQRALIKSWQKHHTCRGELEKWLIACCINEGLDYLKSHKRYQKRLEALSAFVTPDPLLIKRGEVHVYVRMF